MLGSIGTPRPIQKIRVLREKLLDHTRQGAASPCVGRVTIRRPAIDFVSFDVLLSGELGVLFH